MPTPSPNTVIASDDGIFQALEIATDVSIYPSGDYYVHIEDLNGGVDIPFWCLENIMKFAAETIEKHKRDNADDA